MHSHPDVLILGGGIIGLTSAYTLAEAGLRVTLLDRQDFGREASWAGAGILPPGNFPFADSPIDRLRAFSVSQFPDFTRELEARTGLPTGYDVCGGLVFLEGDEADIVEIWKSERIEFEQLRIREVRTCESNLDATLANRYSLIANSYSNESKDLERIAISNQLLAISQKVTDRIPFLFPNFAQIRNPWLLKSLVTACESVGVNLRPNTPTEGWLLEKNRVQGVRLRDGTTLTAEHYLLAAGAWAEPWLAALGCQPGIHPIRGQILLYRTPTPLLRRIVIVGKRYLVPRSDGHLLIGSTEEPEAKFEKETTSAGLASLRNFAEEVIPELKRQEPIQSWAGLRPGSPDGMPYLGFVPGHSNVLAAVGHTRAGIQLSLGTSRILHDLILKRELPLPIEAFRLDRSPDYQTRPAFRS